MKNLLFSCLFLLVCKFIVAKEPPIGDPIPMNFYDLLDKLYENDSTLQLHDSLQSGSTKDIVRMKNLWGERLSPHGDVGLAANAIVNYTEQLALTGAGGSNCEIVSASWQEEGPLGKVDMGAGQIHRITFDPGYGIHNTTIYAGSFYGGLWRSTNDAQSWQSVGTGLDIAQTSVSGIAISHQDSNNLFICTGEGDLRSHQRNKDLFFTNHYGIGPNFTSGIYRSTNYGASWSAINTGFLSHFTDGGTCRNILINPLNENTVFVVSNKGVFRTQNALATNPSWTLLNTPSTTLSGLDFASIKMHPTDTNILYASSDNIYKSTDGGTTWTTMTGLNTGLDIVALPDSFYVKRIKLDVSKADSARIYAYINGKSKAASCNNKFGQTVYIYMFKNGQWQQLEKRVECNPRFTNYSETWMGFAVSPVDAEKVYFGYSYVDGSNDITTTGFGRKSSYLGNGYHADCHELVFQPNTTTPLLFAGTHGGVHTKNTASSGAGGWSFKSNGINSSLIWSFDISQRDAGIRIMGRQDNGTVRTSKSGTGYQWNHFTGGDGYAAQIVFENRKNPLFVSNYSYGNLPWDAARIASNPGQSSYSFKESFTTSFQVKSHPKIDRPFVGLTELYSIPGTSIPTNSSPGTANSWQVESDIFRHRGWLKYRYIREFQMAPSDTNIVYIVTLDEETGNRATGLFRTTTGLKNGTYSNSGTPTFENLTNNLPKTVSLGDTLPPYITGIAVSSKNPLHVWVSITGYNANLHILKSTNGGNTWSNADPNHELPNMPANNIIYQNGTDDRIYVATDVGVYVTDNEMGCWQRFGDIPNVKVMELSVHDCSGKLYAGTYGRGIWSVDMLPTNGSDTELTIDSNTLWNTEQFMRQSIRVTTGNTLSIVGSTVLMPVGGSIIVEKGAKLILDSGAVITNSCGNLWMGIQLIGDNGVNQSNSANQAILEMRNGATLEFAREAVAVMEIGNWSTFGGIIRAEDAIFKNNKRSVSFMSYPYQNNSYFKRCTFKTTSDFLPIYNREPNGPFSMVTIWDNDGINFEGCTFVDSSAIDKFDQLTRGGILTMDANVRVTSNCNDPSPFPTSPCPTQYITQGNFSQLNYGVHGFSGGGLATMEVDECDFTDNAIAAGFESVDNAQFTRNDVKYGGLEKTSFPDSSQLNYITGLHFLHSTGFKIENNSFENTGTPTTPTNGLSIKNSLSNANEVYRNEFENNEIGQFYLGYNRNYLNNYEGLQFLCNTNPISNNYDVRVDKSINLNQFEGIRNYQGSTNPDNSAANIFSTVTQGHIVNNSNQVITYYYSGSNENPTNVTTALVLPTSVSVSNTCPSRFVTQGKGNILMPENALSNYYQLRSNYDGLLYAYYQNIDNGNTDSLLEVIGLTFNEDAQQLRNDLMGEAPYLSENALMDAAQSGILSDAQLLEICLANPDATRNEWFLNFLEFEIPNPLPSNMIQLIYQNWDSETPRTLIENQLATVNADLGRISNEILRFYALDSLDHNDNVMSILESRKSLTDQYRMIELSMDGTDFETCTLLFNTIESSHELQEWQLEEHNNLRDYIAFRESIHNEGISYMQLNDENLVELRSIAAKKTGRSSQLAQNILCFGYNECETSIINPDLRKKQGRIYDMQAKDETISSNVKATIQPNPTNLETLLITEGLKFENSRIEVYSIDGKSLLQQRLNQNNQHINLAALPNGTYIYRILDGEQVVAEDKLVIVK